MSEEIKRVAKELIPDDSDQYFVNQKIDWNLLRYRIEQVIQTQVEAESERCAKIADKYWKFDNNQQQLSSWHDKQDCLKEIRTKPEKE